MMLAHHIKNLDSSTLAKQVWTEHRSQDWPGLAKEVSSICAELGVEDVSTNIVEEKQALKTKVSKACLALNDSKLKESMEGMTKMSELIEGDCRTEPYMDEKSLNQVRETFRTRTNMLEGFKGNFKNWYLGENIKCEGCNQELDTQGHVVDCEEYADIKEGLDLTKDSDLVQFFKNVLKRRAENEK